MNCSSPYSARVAALSLPCSAPECRPLSRQDRRTGIHCRSAAASASSAVLIARRSTEVCSTSGSRPVSARSSPPREASARPLSDSGTSTHPVNRLALFHSLSPCRSSTSVPVVTPVILPDDEAAGSGSERGPDQPELVAGRRREAQQQPVTPDPPGGAPAQGRDQAHAADNGDDQPDDDRDDVDTAQLGEDELHGTQEQRIDQCRGGDDAHQRPDEALLRGAALHRAPR